MPAHIERTGEKITWFDADGHKLRVDASDGITFYKSDGTTLMAKVTNAGVIIYDTAGTTALVTLASDSITIQTSTGAAKCVMGYEHFSVFVNAVVKATLQAGLLALENTSAAAKTVNINTAALTRGAALRDDIDCPSGAEIKVLKEAAA
jgi:hypothetical protein